VVICLNEPKSEDTEHRVLAFVYSGESLAVVCFHMSRSQKAVEHRA
jgi:hypothetical protein